MGNTMDIEEVEHERKENYQLGVLDTANAIVWKIDQGLSVKELRRSLELMIADIMVYRAAKFSDFNIPTDPGMVCALESTETAGRDGC